MQKTREGVKVVQIMADQKLIDEVKVRNKQTNIMVK